MVFYIFYSVVPEVFKSLFLNCFYCGGRFGAPAPSYISAMAFVYVLVQCTVPGYKSNLLTVQIFHKAISESMTKLTDKSWKSMGGGGGLKGAVVLLVSFLEAAS
jgi:hypothetical protein